MKDFMLSILGSRITIGIIQIVIAYFGWSMTAVTIVNSSFNTIGLIIIILSVFLWDGIKLLKWLSNKF